MESNRYKEWKGHIDKAVENLCLRIIKEPLLYFSEADVQQLLVEELRSIEELGKSYPTSVQKGKESKGTYHTSLIHREYGGGSATRIDVVVLDPHEVAKIDSTKLTHQKDYLKPIYAFELGTEKTIDTAGHLRNDLAKLGSKVKENGTGYIIYFFRDTTITPTGNKRRAKTEDKIERVFKSAFPKSYDRTIEKVKILPILIRTGRDQHRMRGKCEIFDGEKWIKVNISRPHNLREAILDRLEIKEGT